MKEARDLVFTRMTLGHGGVGFLHDSDGDELLMIREG